MSGEHTTPDKQDQRRQLGVSLQKKLALAQAESDAKNFLSELDGETDDVFEYIPRAIKSPEVYNVYVDSESTSTTSSMTTMTTILTTPTKQVIRKSVSTARAGNKVDYSRYQSPVRQKVVPVGVVSPSIKDTFRCFNAIPNPGIFGVPICNRDVKECSQRGAAHIHG
jgi:hypothetical protein